MPNAMVATITTPSSRRNRRLVARAHARVEPGVVRQRRDALLQQELRRLLDRVPREAVHDARVTGVLGAQQREQLLQRLVLRFDAVLDVRAVEAGHEQLGAAEVEPRRDLAPGRLGGGRGERDARHGGPALVQHRQPQVVGPEVVAPLRHAVRLVDREQRDRAAIEEVERARCTEPLRREVQQVELAGEVRLLDRSPLVGVLGRVQERGAHADHTERIHLVLHQGDERRDDHAGALADERGHLVAQRLAAAGRHEHDRVATVDDVIDDLPLLTAERRVPERALEHAQGHSGGHAAILRPAGDAATRPGAPSENSTSRRAVHCPRSGR